MAIRMAGMLLVLLAVGLASATDLTFDLTPSGADNWLTGDCQGEGGTLAGNICLRSNMDESDEGVSYTNEATMRWNLTGVNSAAPTYTTFTIESKARNGGSFSANFGTIDNLVVNMNAPSGKALKLDLAKVKLVTFKLYLVQEAVCSPQTATKLSSTAFTVSAVPYSGGNVLTNVLSGMDQHNWWSDMMNAVGIGHVVVANEIVAKPTTTTGVVYVKTLKINIALPKAKACNSAQTWRWLGQGFELSLGSSAAGGVEITDAPSDSSDTPSGDSSSSIVSYALMTLLAMLAVAFSTL